MRHAYHIQDLVILSGQTESRIATKEEFGFADEFSFQSPATLPESVTIEVSNDEGATFGTLQSDGADIILPAGKVTVVKYQGWDEMRLASGSAVAADRAFQVKPAEELR